MKNKLISNICVAFSMAIISTSAWAGTIEQPISVDEPGTILLLGGAVAALGILKWKNKKK